MPAQLYTFSVPTPEDYRDNYLRSIKASLQSRGILDPNVGPNSDFYIEATALGNELSVNAANGILSADAMNWDTATGDDLFRHAARYQLFLRSAGGSVGPVVFSSTATSTVATDQELTDANGLSYKVVVGGIFNNGDTITIQAIGVGTITNLATGSSLQWRSTPAYSAPTVLVGLGGLINGVDSESEEGLRQRIAAKVGNPSGSGNPSHLAEIAEASSPSVQKAFVYPALQGPSTSHIAVTAAPTATNPNRSISTIIMNGTVIPYILGVVPTRTYSVNTTVTNVLATVSIGLSLPAAPTASPPGPGGGWLDGSPWPQVSPSTGVYRVPIVLVLSSVRFIIDPPVTLPVPNVSKVAWFSYSEQKLYKATVVSYNTGTGELIIDSPFIGIGNNDLIFPQSANQDQYFAAIKAAFELMGPGEKTTNVSALLRAFRHPVPTTSWPSGIGPNILRALTDAGSEVASTQFFYRFDGTSTSTNTSDNFIPAVPVTITNPPNIFVPFRVAIYQTV